MGPFRDCAQAALGARMADDKRAELRRRMNIQLILVRFAHWSANLSFIFQIVVTQGRFCGATM